MINLTAITVVRSTCLFMLCVGMQACVIPVPWPGDEEVFIEKELIESIQVGQTGKTDLLHKLGHPDWSLNDGSRWIYRTRYYRPAGMGVLTEGGGQATKSLMSWRDEFLYIMFNSSGVTDKLEISLTAPDLGGGWSKRYINADICTDGYGGQPLYGSADDDIYAKRFLAEPDHCAVYLYTSTTSTPFFVQIDEVIARHRCPSNIGFLRINVNTGEHKITVVYKPETPTRKVGEPAQSGRQLSEAIEFDCAPQRIYFMREHHGYPDGFSFTMVEEEEGRRHVGERNLVLLQDLD